MKTKKNIFFFTLCMMLVSIMKVNASSTTKGGGGGDGRFSIGAELAIPTGDLGNHSSIGYGLSLRYEIPTGDNFAFTGTAGYVILSSKTTNDGYGNTTKYTNSMIPIQVGMKYYFQEQQDGFYAHVQVGISSFSSKSESNTAAYTYYSYTIPASSSSSTSTSTNLSYSPGLGYHLPNVDICFHYQIISTSGGSSSYQGIRIAYVFGGH